VIGSRQINRTGIVSWLGCREHIQIKWKINGKWFGNGGGVRRGAKGKESPNKLLKKKNMPEKKDQEDGGEKCKEGEKKKKKGRKFENTSVEKLKQADRRR